jgi:hypothetical protein
MYALAAGMSLFVSTWEIAKFALIAEGENIPQMAALHMQQKFFFSLNDSHTFNRLQHAKTQD